MDRCEPIDHDDYKTADLLYADAIWYKMNAETLPQNVGILDGEPVLIDYCQ